jgi:hypothetical protein
LASFRKKRVQRFAIEPNALRHRLLPTLPRPHVCGIGFVRHVSYDHGELASFGRFRVLVMSPHIQYRFTLASFGRFRASFSQKGRLGHFAPRKDIRTHCPRPIAPPDAGYTRRGARRFIFVEWASPTDASLRGQRRWEMPTLRWLTQRRAEYKPLPRLHRKVLGGLRAHRAISNRHLGAPQSHKSRTISIFCLSQAGKDGMIPIAGIAAIAGNDDPLLSQSRARLRERGG